MQIVMTVNKIEKIENMQNMSYDRIININCSSIAVCMYRQSMFLPPIL